MSLISPSSGASLSSTQSKQRITAVLGPTNTGKTHLALERMLGYATGMIGFPLRLLARENYDRIVRLKGPAAVALITGEERIVPPHPRWTVCTVEAMPLGQRVDFLAIDEVQLAADPDRGHVFTDRILHARGREETMFLGSETIKPLLKALVPGAEFVTRPRFSQLTYSGPKKLTRLPRRSAVVAFSSADVYSIAELIRRQSGGAAVVLGALSPRTRNAQVAMFQAGEVEHLVATDAIGMGLNMDIDHVCFAALRKFDGRVPRDLEASEVAQIAGRAGRHMNDGTFGTTTDLAGMDPELIERVENHEFQPLRGIFWRNPDLRFTSLEALLGSLARPPDRPGLIRIRPADDQLALEALVREDDIRTSARALDRLRLLWEVSQIPDFRKVTPESHARFLAIVYRHLIGPSRKLPQDWVATHLAALDRIDGDMHVLMERIASIRVWTYISHRVAWLADAREVQERARAIEDRLSDALHQSLTQRFVDVRTSVLSARLKQGGPLLAAVSRDDRVMVEGQHLGTLEGLTFVPEKGESRAADRAVVNAAGKALRGELARRVVSLSEDEDAAFSLSPDNRLCWQGAEVAALTVGADRLHPQVESPQDEFLDGDQRDKVKRRLTQWVRTTIETVLHPLASPPPETLSGAARGVLYRLAEGLGTVSVREAREQLRALSSEDRKALARVGVRLGTESLYLPALLKAAPQRWRATLWSVWAGKPVPALPGARVSFERGPEQTPEFCLALGYIPVGPRAIRADALERFAAVVRETVRGWSESERSETGGPLPGQTSTLIGLSPSDAVPVLESLGYLVMTTGKVVTFKPSRLKQKQKRARPSSRKGKLHKRQDEADSPFAILKKKSALEGEKTG